MAVMSLTVWNRTGKGIVCFCAVDPINSMHEGACQCFCSPIDACSKIKNALDHRLSTASIVPKLKSSSSSKPGSSPRGFFSSILMRRSSSFSASMATAAAAFLAAS